jgi:NAD(P)-dependent dehydrogenase (short-subunit alcohol dehydrogenase family)
MRVVITGHTGGLGLAFFNYFTSRGDEVIGVSRSNGYSLPEKFEDVIKLADTADLFVNNLHLHTIQYEFLRRLHNKIAIVTCGSMAADYPRAEIIQYSTAKKLIEGEHKRLKKESQFPMLLLKMGFLENWTQYDSIPYQQVINGVDYWLMNPRVSILEFDNIYYNTNFTK